MSESIEPKGKIRKKPFTNFVGFSSEVAKRTAGILVKAGGPFLVYNTKRGISLMKQFELTVSPATDVISGAIEAISGYSSEGDFVFGIRGGLTDSTRRAVGEMVKATGKGTFIFPLNHELAPNLGDTHYYIADKKGTIITALPMQMQNVRLHKTSGDDVLLYTTEGKIMAITLKDASMENYGAGKTVIKLNEEVIFLAKVEDDEKGEPCILATTEKKEGIWIGLSTIGKIIKGYQEIGVTTVNVDIPEKLKGSKALVHCGGDTLFGVLAGRRIAIAPMYVAAA